MKAALAFFVVIVMSSEGSASGPTPDAVVTNQEVENFYRELANPECDSSPGGSVAVPIQELQQLIQPAASTPQRRVTPRRAGATR